MNSMNRLIALLTIVMMGVGSAMADTWDGTIANNAKEKFAENGITLKTPGQANSATNPYTIDNAKEFAYFISIVKNKWTGYTSEYYWQLTTDIDLNNIEWTHGSNSGNPFQGHFDGGGHTIKNVSFNVTTNSNYGLFPTIQGASATNLAEVKNLKIDGVTFTSAASRAATTRLGGLAGYAKQADISNIEVKNVTFTYTNTITNTNQLGGLIGCIENDTKIDNVAVVGVTATFSNTTTGLYVGGLVGASTGNVNTNSITNCNVKTVKFDHTSNVTGTTYVGGLVGNANTSLSTISNNTVEGVSGQNDGKGLDVNISGSSYTFYVGGLLGYTTGVKHEVKNNSTSNISIKTIGQTYDVRLGGLIGAVATNDVTGVNLIKSNTASAVSISANDSPMFKSDGKSTGLTALGGLIGHAAGKASPSNRTLIQGNTVTNPTLTMNGDVNIATLYLGGFLGYADSHTNVFNNKVDTAKVTIAGNINAAAYVGGAVGAQNNYTTIDGMQVSGGSISGPSTSKTVKNNVAFFVGGFIGQMNSSATDAYKTNKFMNIAVTGIDINLANYVPGGIINNHKFAVGGIAGSVNAPNRDVNGFCGMPENLIFKGGKIYAPWASTSPTVPNFNSGTAAHNNMTTEGITSIDALDKCKVKTWYYTDYKLGLSAEFLNSSSVKAYNAAPAKDEFRKNYSVSPKKENGISYITVKNTTFLQQNRYQDSERDSRTVLWWTNQNNWAATGATAASFTKEEQPIYPQYNFGTVGTAELTKFPYYMYFYQGVSNATYVTSAVSDKIIAGIEGNFKEAQKEKPLVLTIANSKENVRGFDALTISVKAMVGEDDVTNNYSYQWYVDGKAKTTATSFSLRPHWKNGQGITLNALIGDSVIATATYTLAPGVMKTKAGATELVRSDYTKRGTKDNPYIIDHEYALRQWSYLSTLNTNTRWEGIVVPAVDPKNQSQGHYNRAYYELSKDITMSNTDFVPISHVGYGSDVTWGTWGSNHCNWLFQGHFDGKLHAIKNLHIKWGAGQYNGNDVNIYYGLFGAVGNSTATAKWGETDKTNTVIKNLVIDGAVLTHDVSNTTFSYQKDYKHITAANANNCMVGVLAGVVASNTTIQNIEIRNSKITDEGSEEYSLATKGLYVGGAIGSVQHEHKTISTLPVSLTIDHVAANVNISLKNPVFQSSSAIDQLCLFNVGGIIGRLITTSGTQAQVKDIMPKYTFFSGDVVAPKAWVSPVLASLRYTSNQKLDNNFSYFSKQWEGNNNVAGSQVTITNAHYYNYSIDGKLITELYPESKCIWDARSITAHADGNGTKETYTTKMFQGVNYGAIWVDAEGSSLKTLNENKVDETYWTWKDGFVHMTKTPSLDAYLTSVENAEGTGVVLTANMSDESTGTYRWQESFDGASWIDLDGETLQSYPSAYVNMPKLIVSYITVGGKEYRTLPFMVHAINMAFSPYLKSEGIDENGDGEDDKFSFEVKWKNDDVPNSSYEVTYQWCKSDGLTPTEGKTSNTLELDKDGLDEAGGSVWCVIRINYMGREISKFSIRSYIDATVVFIDGTNGIDNTVGSRERGWTPETAVKTIDHANSLLKSADDGGTWDNNIIVIMGTLNPNDFRFQSNGTNPATLTGKWNGIDYNGVIKIEELKPKAGEHTLNLFRTIGSGTNCYVLGDTKFENLTFYGNNGANCFIELHGRDVTFGKGLVMKNFKNLSKAHGNMGESEKIPELTIVFTATNLSKEEIDLMVNRSTPQVVTFQSGHYGRILSGRFTQYFFWGNYDGTKKYFDQNTSYSILGSATHPVWAIVNVDIDNENEMTDGGSVTYTRDINAIIAGLTDGSMYGDFEVNFHGGNISYIVGANQGNAMRNGEVTYTPKDGEEGTFGQWPNASFFGRSVINIEQDPKLKSINIGHLYAGGLGRDVQAASTSRAPVDMYLYGRTEVNIKSGNISGNVYGGGTGGVIGVNPWDDHMPYATKEANDGTKAIIDGVQYGDNPAWSSMTKESPLAKVVLHNRKATGDGYEIDSLDMSNSSTTLNISGGTINGNVYGGGYGEVPDMPILSAMQGIGSVFGTTNINITGGVIDGSVYGGSRGSITYYNIGKNAYGQYINHIAEMNGTVNLRITGDEYNYPTIRGNIYGAGQGLEAAPRKATDADVEEGKAVNVGDTYTEEYLRIATTGNKDLLGEDHETNVNILIDLPENAPFNGNIYGGGEFGVVDGNTNITIKRGTFNGNIFGGGKGKNNDANRNKAKVNGSTNVKIGNKIMQ